MICHPVPKEITDRRQYIYTGNTKEKKNLYIKNLFGCGRFFRGLFCGLFSRFLCAFFRCLHGGFPSGFSGFKSVSASISGENSDALLDFLLDFFGLGTLSAGLTTVSVASSFSTGLATGLTGAGAGLATGLTGAGLVANVEADFAVDAEISSFGAFSFLAYDP